jgi:hypothetical protein
LNTLSIFIDESGEVGTNSEFYILTLVFHEQSNSISSQVNRLSETLKEKGLPGDNALHTGPIIRREDEYRHVSLGTRQWMFDKLLTFTRTCKIKYKTFICSKREYPSRVELVGRLTREVTIFFRDNLEYFTSFEHIIAYYDNGQAEISAIVNASLNANLFNTEIRNVEPVQYRLFQSADLFCTLEMVNRKFIEKRMSNSEQMFFKTRRRFIKVYLKFLDEMRFEQ